jgi:putative Mg2+ transporter-C (MgtC) family protein
MDTLNHLIHQWMLDLGSDGEALVRLFLAAVLGALVGLERKLRGHEAGFRTNLLVCVGSALVMLVSIRFADHPWPVRPGYNINVDPGRIAYGVMTGIGFLGAGAILKQDTTIRGLTTAAALWCVAAIGLACGFGMYVLATSAAALVLFALWLLDIVESALPRRHFRKLTIRRPWNECCVSELAKRFADAGIRVEDQSFHRLPDLAEVDVQIHISYTNAGRYDAIEKSLHADSTCRLIASERS